MPNVPAPVIEKCVRWDAYMRGGFAIMPHMPAPLI
ncbi:hypothetical protein MASE_10360 [Alteromonas macleodii ATCC 27126]|nr:hypothetical protein MASE_10360 [Alteromonas macleodii ATCC 27126]